MPTEGFKATLFTLPRVVYKLYALIMTVTATTSDFRREQSHYLDVAQREPVSILSRGTRRRAVVVSPDFYDRAVEALEDIEDIRAAAQARTEKESISFEDLKKELGLE